MEGFGSQKRVEKTGKGIRLTPEAGNLSWNAIFSLHHCPAVAVLILRGICGVLGRVAQHCSQPSVFLSVQRDESRLDLQPLVCITKMLKTEHLCRNYRDCLFGATLDKLGPFDVIHCYPYPDFQHPLSQTYVRSRHARCLPHRLVCFDDAGKLVEFNSRVVPRLRR